MWPFHKKKNDPEIDLNKPVENPNLKVAMVRHKEIRSDSSAIAVGQEIAKALFLIPTITDKMEIAPTDIEGKITIKKGSIIKILNCFNDANECFLPVFTDWEEIKNWTKESVDSFIMPFSHMCSFVEDKEYMGVVINPGSICWTLTKANILALNKDFKIK